jgi:hypothetical protein
MVRTPSRTMPSFEDNSDTRNDDLALEDDTEDTIRSRTKLRMTTSSKMTPRS